MNSPLVRQYSDMHLDWYAHQNPESMLAHAEKHGKGMIDLFWTPPPLSTDNETTLLLVGDLWIGTKSFLWGNDFSWIKHVSQQFKKVLIVFGNHDYWPQGHCSMKNIKDKANLILAQLGIENVFILEKDTHQDGDHIFVGCTLWTDMDNASPFVMFNMPRTMAYDGKIIYETHQNQGFKFTSQQWIVEHQKSKDYIRHVAANNPNKKIVVLTHHLPLMQMCDPHYSGDDSNFYYASDLSDLILDNPNIVYWGCGHSHHRQHFNFEQCLLHMNPVGYQSEHREQEGLVSHEAFRLP